MAKNLVIVESPSKAKTIGKFLGSNYKVRASVGHIRDLPKSKLGIDIDNDFEPNYITIRGKGDIIKELKKEASKADKVFLATDPDREGEAISWHLATILKLNQEDNIRIEFHEITKNAVTNAKKTPRKINMDLVDSQQARRVLDRIVGYQISPLLWRKVEKGLSAGRVQSVAVKLIYDREKEIEAFVPEEYWTIDGDFGKDEIITARLIGEMSDDKVKRIKINNIDEMTAILDILKKHNSGTINKITNKKFMKAPLPPYTTSSLQQDASRNLNFTTKKTMMIAQQLYEGIDIKGEGTTGLVTYIRTDSIRVSEDSKAEAAGFIKEKYGDKYLKLDRVYKKKKKSDSQDAHEAIRPTYSLKTPDSIKASLSNDQYKLYKMIWNRFISSLMTSAEFENIGITIVVADYAFRYTGKRLLFDGFMKVTPVKEKLIEFPDMTEGDSIDLKKLVEKQNFTNPPARYNEASLVKIMEELGIGRPSTYSPTVSTILNRGYVEKKEGHFYITDIGVIVTELLVEHFGEFINEKFTAALEDKLDNIETGDHQWKEIIREFYKDFEIAMSEADKKIEKVELEDETTDVICDKCGSNMIVKKGRFGKFLACPNYPECKNTMTFGDKPDKPKVSDEICEKCGVNMVVKRGRYGDFLACPNYPDCKNTKQIVKKLDVKCPKCNGDVVEKRTKKGRKFYGCSNYPKCDYTSWKEPVAEKCESCGELKVLDNKSDGGEPVCTNKDCKK
ncbi:MAG: type I DNA topoisomerase [Dethiosulfatibacter sp.]|nr:type I DNA topoisomerase [Dethiosulfatibacter sp.]